jgi:chromate transporter
MSIVLTLSDVMTLFVHCLSISLLAVGGGLILAPDMHRLMVDEKSWLTEEQFTSSLALAQSAPGPNVLYVAMLGWNAGMNAGSYAMAMACVAATLVGIMLPTTLLTLSVTRWAHRNREWIGLRAFKQGLSPIVIGLLLSTVWLLSAVHNDPSRDWKLWLLTVVAGVVLYRTSINLLWVLGAGALVGALGWV